MTDWKKLAEEQREAELRRGREIGARAALAERFDPDYVPNSGISLAERRRRDEYIKNLPNGRW